MVSQKINFDFFSILFKPNDTTSETQMCNTWFPYKIWRSIYLCDYLRNVPYNYINITNEVYNNGQIFI